MKFTVSHRAEGDEFVVTCDYCGKEAGSLVGGMSDQQAEQLANNHAIVQHGIKQKSSAQFAIMPGQRTLVLTEAVPEKLEVDEPIAEEAAPEKKSSGTSEEPAV